MTRTARTRLAVWPFRRVDHPVGLEVVLDHRARGPGHLGDVHASDAAVTGFGRGVEELRHAVARSRPPSVEAGALEVFARGPDGLIRAKVRRSSAAVATALGVPASVTDASLPDGLSGPSPALPNREHAAKRSRAGSKRRTPPAYVSGPRTGLSNRVTGGR